MKRLLARCLNDMVKGQLLTTKDCRVTSFLAMTEEAPAVIKKAFFK